MNQTKEANKVRNSEGVENALDGLIYKSVEKSNDFLNFSLNVSADSAAAVCSSNPGSDKYFQLCTPTLCYVMEFTNGLENI